MDVHNVNLRYVTELYNELQKLLGISLSLPARTEYPAWSLDGKAQAVVTFAFAKIPNVTDDWMTIRAFVTYNADGSLGKIVTLTISVKSLKQTADARTLVYRIERTFAATIHRTHGKRYILNESDVSMLAS